MKPNKNYAVDQWSISRGKRNADHIKTLIDRAGGIVTYMCGANRTNIKKTSEAATTTNTAAVTKMPI